MSQHISVIGQVATEPKLFAPEGGVQFCTFRLACTERRFDSQKNEWVDAETNWFTINSFRTLATHAKESFAKGDRVIVSGRLRIRNWEKEEKRGTSVEIDIDGIGHDVRWGVSSFTKRVGAATQTSMAERTEQPEDAAAEHVSTDTGTGQSLGNWADPTDPTGETDGTPSTDGFIPGVTAA